MLFGSQDVVMRAFDVLWHFFAGAICTVGARELKVAKIEAV
jgi:hypothetical protein